jgi:hypothetical protein
MIKLCPYETDAGRRYLLEKIIDSARTNDLGELDSDMLSELHPSVPWARSTDTLKSAIEMANIRFVMLSDKNTSAFMHPIITTRHIPGSHGHRRTYGNLIDARPYLKYLDRETLGIKRSVASQFGFIILRTVLSGILENDDRALIGARKNSGIIYAFWIGTMLARHTGIEGMTKLKIEVLAAYYYLCHFYGLDAMGKDGTMFNNMVRSISDMFVGIGNAEVLNILEGVPENGLHSLEDFVGHLYTVTESEQFKDFTVSSLLRCMNSSWVGPDARETVAMGLEHVPTFLAMCYYAINHRDYQRNPLNKIIENVRSIKPKVRAELDNTITNLVNISY